MATERSRQLVLGGLVVVLIVVLVKMWPGTSAPPPPTSNGAGSTTGPKQPQTAAATGPLGVHLDALNGERPKPETAERNLFRFKPKAPPPQSIPVQPVQQVVVPAAPTGPPPPPALPPITLKFIGVVEAPIQG